LDIELLKDLIEKREDIDAQIVAAVGKVVERKKDRKPQTCSKCGSEEHSARTCPTKAGM
jgi:hypothetical protein